MFAASSTTFSVKENVPGVIVRPERRYEPPDGVSEKPGGKLDPGSGETT
jgi:hypothetical protein